MSIRLGEIVKTEPQCSQVFVVLVRFHPAWVPLAVQDREQKRPVPLPFRRWKAVPQCSQV